jgi:hypothetical protein
MFGMEYDQRAIIKCLWNEKADACDIAARLQAQFAEHIYQLQMIQFGITEILLGRQDAHDEIHTGRSPLDDLDTKILAILDKFPFESTHSTAERLLIAHSIMLRHLHDFIGFKLFHLHWVPHMLTDDLREKRK